MRERINKYCVDCLMNKYAGEEQCKCWRTALTNIPKSVYLLYTKEDMCATLLAYHKHIQETCVLDTLTKVYTYNSIWTKRSLKDRKRVRKTGSTQTCIQSDRHRSFFSALAVGLGNLPRVSIGLSLLILRASTWVQLSNTINSVEQKGETAGR